MQEQFRHSAALAVAAAQQGRWQDALAHAHTCRRLAPSGSYLQAWALHMLACTYLDAGRPQLAQVFAHAYRKAARSIPEAERFNPFVLRVLSHVAYKGRQFPRAALLRAQALAEFERQGNHAEVTRTRLNLVWAYAKAGRAQMARQILGELQEQDHLYQGAQAAVMAAEGNWQGALDAGRSALLGARLAHDFADAAEVALIVARALQALGAQSDTFAYIIAAAEFAARQDQSAAALLLLSDRAGGGEFLHAAVARGSADLLDRGSFTTGVG